MKYACNALPIDENAVAPARERGLKCKIDESNRDSTFGRSREGAWIEMFVISLICSAVKCRSREGAWIEMLSDAGETLAIWCRSREGAWIEISVFFLAATIVYTVAPARERGLKCSPTLEKLWPYGVAPARERGLKYQDT